MVFTVIMRNYFNFSRIMTHFVSVFKNLSLALVFSRLLGVTSLSPLHSHRFSSILPMGPNYPNIQQISENVYLLLDLSYSLHIIFLLPYDKTDESNALYNTLTHLSLRLLALTKNLIAPTTCLPLTTFSRLWTTSVPY